MRVKVRLTYCGNSAALGASSFRSKKSHSFITGALHPQRTDDLSGNVRLSISSHYPSAKAPQVLGWSWNERYPATCEIASQYFPARERKTHESCIHACLFRNHSFSRPWFGWLAMDHSVDVRRGESPVVWIFRDSDSFEGGIYVPFYASFLCEDVEYLLWVCLSERMNEREVRTWDWGCCWQMEGQDVWMRIWGCQLM